MIKPLIKRVPFRKFFFCIVLSAVSLIGHAQRKDPLGYVVINGDTTHGIIAFQSLDKMEASIRFRKSATDDWITYTAGVAQSFSVLGLVYEAKKTETDFSSIQISDVRRGIYQNRVRDTLLFLKAEWRSNVVSLYSLDDLHGRVHYYISKNDRDEPRELRQKMAFIDDKMATQNEYWGTLRVLLSDCESITETQIRDTRFFLSDFKIIARNYMSCKNGTPLLLKKPESQNENDFVFATVYVAPGLTSLTFSGDKTLYEYRLAALANGNFGTSSTWQFGAAVGFRFRRFQRLDVMAETGFRRYDAHSDVSLQPLPNGTYRQMFDISMSYIRLAPSIRYRFLPGRISPYLRVGVSINKLMTYTANFNLRVTFPPTTINKPEPAFGNERKADEHGYFGAVGLKAGKFSVEFRREIGDGIFDGSTAYSSKTESSSIFLSYVIIK